MNEHLDWLSVLGELLPLLKARVVHLRIKKAKSTQMDLKS